MNFTERQNELVHKRLKRAGWIGLLECGMTLTDIEKLLVINHDVMMRFMIANPVIRTKVSEIVETKFKERSFDGKHL